ALSLAAPPGANPADAQLHRLFNDYWQLKLKESPTHATYLGVHRYDDQLDDLSETQRIVGMNRRRAMLKQLDHINGAQASAANQLRPQIFRRFLNHDIEPAQFPAHYMPVLQQNGPHITLPMLRLSQPMATQADCRRYAERLK